MEGALESWTTKKALTTKAYRTSVIKQRTNMNNEEAQELGCNLGPRMMIVLLVVLNMWWGEVEDIMDLVGVIST